jgi:hypothetical protein
MNYMINSLGEGAFQAAASPSPGEQAPANTENPLNLDRITEMARHLMAENPDLQNRASEVFNALSQNSDPHINDNLQEIISQITQDLNHSSGTTTENAKSSAAKEDRPDNTTPHQAESHIYFAANIKAKLRIERQFHNPPDSPPQAQQIYTSQSPPRWALKSSTLSHTNKPHWPDLLGDSALSFSPELISLADQARRLSEQVWGAAYGDHNCITPITLVFHDGILTRAAWGGKTPGNWDTDRLHPGSTSDPIALLCAFLEDPTDDKLEKLPFPKPLLSIG